MYIRLVSNCQQYKATVLRSGAFYLENHIAARKVTIAVQKGGNFFADYCDTCEHYCSENDEEEFEYDEEQDEYVENYSSGGECEGGTRVLREGRCALNLEYLDIFGEREIEVSLPDYIYRTYVKDDLRAGQESLFYQVGDMAFPLALGNVWSNERLPSEFAKICWGKVENNSLDLAASHNLFWDSLFNSDLLPSSSYTAAEWVSKWNPTRNQHVVKGLRYKDEVTPKYVACELSTANACGFLMQLKKPTFDSSITNYEFGFVLNVGGRFFLESPVVSKEEDPPRPIKPERVKYWDTEEDDWEYKESALDFGDRLNTYYRELQKWEDREPQYFDEGFTYFELDSTPPLTGCENYISLTPVSAETVQKAIEESIK